jgi:hypothetical protein
LALPDIFSRRKRQAAATGTADVYSYDDLPNKLRVQITQIIDDVLQPTKHGRGETVYRHIVEELRKELGRYQLNNIPYNQDPREEAFNWFLAAPELDYCLDLVEIAFRIIDVWVRENSYRFSEYWRSDPDDAIAELNARFLEAGIGYQFEAGQVIRVDSQLIHAEVVKPTIALLRAPEYAAVEQEFMEAHRLYREGDYEKALTECCKAFESTLKVITTKRGWTVAPPGTSKPLLDAVFNNGLVPEYTQGEFKSLRAVLESGIPTVRNKASGHGAGTAPRVVSQELAAFQIHQTAAAILYLVQAEQNLP